MQRVIRRRVFDDEDGWVVEERLAGESDDDATGRATRSYYYREQLAIRQELDSKIAKRVSGFTLIEKDIRTIKSETLRSLVPADLGLAPKILVARAVFVAIVTTYGKLFVTAEGRSTSLDAKGWVSTEHKTWHEQLMHMRHSFTAHAGEGAESCETVLVIDCALSDRTGPRLFTELLQPTFPGLPELEGIEQLLSVLQARAKAALDKATAALYDEVRETFTPEKLKFLRMGALGTRLVR